MKLRCERTKMYAGISVWAKQEGITESAAVEEIASLNLSLTNLPGLLCPTKPELLGTLRLKAFVNANK